MIPWKRRVHDLILKRSQTLEPVASIQSQFLVRRAFFIFFLKEVFDLKKKVNK